jgi:rSAM/selenodomain-associated transferase 2/rSAM/selenodomain-associated transferase 1
VTSTAERLILFTRYPEPGTTKTRLIPVLGPEGAAEFQRRLTERSARAAKEVQTRREVSLEIRHEGGGPVAMRQWLGAEFSFRPQGGGDIGARMEQSLNAAFAEGAERVVIIGSDIPGLRSATVIQAFDALEHHDLVFGPATDGGYYLIGTTAGCFRGDTSYFGEKIGWGGPDVLTRTLGMMRDARLTFTLLETLADVDRPQDLPAAMQALCLETDRPVLSVVIPALDEAEQLGATLAVLAPNPEVEVLVIDGGSTDATADIARAAGVRTLMARPPRSIQMNAGAAAANADILMFLHADTRLPLDFPAQVRQTMADDRVAAGAFHLQIDAAGKGLRLIEQVANWRSSLLQMPYGDQALFLRRDLFWDLGAFLPIPIMEDFELVQRLKPRGRIVLAPGTAMTSARRWLKLGVWRTWLINQAVIGAYYAGVSPQRLAGWYRGKKR